MHACPPGTKGDTHPAGRRVSVHLDVTEVHDFLGVIPGQRAGELLEDLAFGGLAGGGVGDLDDDVGPRLEAGDLALEVVRAEGDAEVTIRIGGGLSEEVVQDEVLVVDPHGCTGNRLVVLPRNDSRGHDLLVRHANPPQMC